MPATGLILVGGGEHARVLADAIDAGGSTLPLLGFVDTAVTKLTDQGVVYLGDDSALAGFTNAAGVLAFASLASQRRRPQVIARLEPVIAQWATIVHPAAWVSPRAQVAAGAVVMAGAIVQGGARIGEHAVVNSGAVIEHDVVIGDFAQIGSRAVLGGGARVGARSYVGLGAAIRDHVTIGDDVIVGMGGVVVRDVSNDVTIKGVPAR